MVFMVLALLAACERGTPTSPVSPHIATGGKPAFDGLITSLSGPTEITSTGSYGYQACAETYGTFPQVDIQFFINNQPADRFHINTAADLCQIETVNVTTTTSDFTIFAVIKIDGFNQGTSNTLTVHNYTRPLSVLVAGYTTVATGVECEYDAVASGGKPPYTYQWYVDDSPLGGSPSVIYETFSSNGTHDVRVEITDALAQHASSFLTVTSEDPVVRGCPQ